MLRDYTPLQWSGRRGWLQSSVTSWHLELQKQLEAWQGHCLGIVFLPASSSSPSTCIAQMHRACAAAQEMWAAWVRGRGQLRWARELQAPSHRGVIQLQRLVGEHEQRLVDSWLASLSTILPILDQKLQAVGLIQRGRPRGSNAADASGCPALELTLTAADWAWLHEASALAALRFKPSHANARETLNRLATTAGSIRVTLDAVVQAVEACNQAREAAQRAGLTDSQAWHAMERSSVMGQVHLRWSGATQPRLRWAAGMRSLARQLCERGRELEPVEPESCP